MSKKKNKHKNVLSSLKELGNDSRDTLSRLATTVRADMPTLVLGRDATPGATMKNDGLAPVRSPEVARGSSLKRLAKSLVPFRSAEDRKTARKLKKLANQMAKGKTAMPLPKIRKSRLPFVIAMLVALFAWGGYTAYKHVSLPNVKVAQYLDYKKWLNTASGNTKHPASHTTVGNGGQKAAYATAANKAPKSKASPKKQKVWKKKLAKLKKKADAKYQKASYKKKAGKKKKHG